MQYTNQEIEQIKKSLKSRHRGKWDIRLICNNKLMKVYYEGGLDDKGGTIILNYHEMTLAWGVEEATDIISRKLQDPDLRTKSEILMEKLIEDI